MAPDTYAYDVAIAVSTDAGRSWSRPVTPHDDGTATEHGFVTLYPWSDAIGAIWLDGRNTVAPQPDAPIGAMTLRSATVAPDLTTAAPQLIDARVCDCCQTDVAVAAGGPVSGVPRSQRR